MTVSYTHLDMMFIVWGLVAILMIVLNMIEVIRRQKEVVVRASLGENAAVDVYKRQLCKRRSFPFFSVPAALPLRPRHKARDLGNG